MKKPTPQTGDIIKFDYKWRSEHEEGKIDGGKERPCAVVLAHEHKKGEPPRLLVAPITHTEPKKGVDSIALTGRMRQASGLDKEPQWVITQEVNVVNWDNAGIVPAKPGKQWLIGTFPRGLAEAVYKRVRDNSLNKKMTMIDRERPSHFKKKQ